MAGSPSVDDLIQVAIQAERATEELYRLLTKMFAHVAEVARFITGYAADETAHVVWLESLRGKLGPEKLAAPAIPLMHQEALRVSQAQVGKKLESVENLEDAYQLMVDIVHGEANQLLRSLINTYYEDESTRVFLLDHLRQHTERISKAFPAAYATRQARKSVKAIRN